MRRLVIIILLSVTMAIQLAAQILPGENSKLYWRIVGFSFPDLADAVQYKIEIAKGNYNTDNSFEKNIITSVNGTKPKLIAEVPSFGAQYTWRIIFSVKNNNKLKSTLYHFSIKTAPDVDATATRLRIMKNTGKYKDSYVMIDGTRVLYDMKGNPVWFLPGIDLPANHNASPLDIKLTSDGTITFLANSQPYEITYSGNILWRMPPNTNTPFHHEFTRLPNGHYMALVYEDITGVVPPYRNDTSVTDVYDSSGFYRSRLYSSLVEYDRQGAIVWHWSSLDYINNSDMALRKSADVPILDHDLHVNAFFFDENNKTVYLSLRNINRIIKIKYPEGNVLNTYGTLYEPGTWQFGNDLFSGQHSVRRSQNGYLYLYNNNVEGQYHIPTISMFAEPGVGKKDLKKIWEYQCTVEGFDTTEKENLYFHKGGDVYELPDQSFFVMMGTPYPKIFIVNREKKILWSAIAEKYDSSQKKWEYYTGSFRASITTRKELEQLIWNSEKDRAVIKSIGSRSKTSSSGPSGAGN